MSPKTARMVALLAGLSLAAPFAFADHDININTADKATLETLNGIGPSKAQAIIDYRTQNGPFATIEDIQNVSGIGPATYANIKDHITVQGGNSTSTPPTASPSPSPSPSGATPSPTPSSSSSVFSIDGGSDRVVVVGADVQFSARAYSGKSTLENTAFSWNFGDGSTAQGAHVTHSFEYPGRHAVVVTGSSDDSTASDSFSVTAEVAQLSLRVLSDGSVQIENLATREADLSRWIIQSSGQRFTLPENSLVLAGQTMRISPNTLHFYASDTTELDYPSGALAFRAETGSVEALAAPLPELSPRPSSIQEESPRDSASTRPARVPSPQPASELIERDEPRESMATSAKLAAAGGASSSWPWWLGVAGISIGTATAIFVSRRYGKYEWNIIEDTNGSV